MTSDALDPGTRLQLAIDAVSEQVDAMRDADWSSPSPCDGWDGRAVVDHVAGTLTGILGMLSGEDYRASKSDASATDSPDDAAQRWRDLADRARVAAGDLDPSRELSGPMGPGPASMALAIPTHDLTVHAWDLAATGGRRWEIPESLRADLDNLVRNTPEEILRSPGLFGPELEPAPDANPTERVMAFLGRSRPS